MEKGFPTCIFPEFEATQFFFDYIYKNEFLKLADNIYPMKTIKEKQESFFILWDYYIEQKKKGIDSLAIIDEIGNSTFNMEEYHNKYACSWEDIKIMSDDPLCTIGSHAMHHNRLIDLSDAELDMELRESKRIIEQKTGKEVNYISYPYGLSNNKVVKYTKKYYKAACKLRLPHSNRTYAKKSDNLYKIPRQGFVCSALIDTFTAPQPIDYNKFADNKFIKLFFNKRVKKGQTYYRILGIKVPAKV